MELLEAFFIVLCLDAVLPVRGQTSPAGAPPDPVPTDHTDRGQDGSYRFQYTNNDRGQHYHGAVASADNTVAGRYGYREPGTGRITETQYTAGQRGFRAQGPDIARKMDLSQAKIPYAPPIPPDSPAYQPSYDTYHDPNEDASYDYNIRTPTLVKSETSGPRGDTAGQYSYIDDVGKRHDVQYEAGAGVGFHVRTPFPDSDPFGGLFYTGPNKPGTPLRGHTSIQRGKDGSYKFVSTGPDQKRTEISDASGRVRGSYTYIDDKGVQRTVDYIAGPGIGYKIVNKGTNPVFPTIYPFVPPNYYPLNFPDPKASPPPIFKPSDSPAKAPDFGDDLFGKADVKTPTPSPTPKSDSPSFFDVSSPGPTSPSPKPTLFDVKPTFSIDKSSPFPHDDGKYKPPPPFVKPLYQPAFTTPTPPSFLGPDSSINDHINDVKPFDPPIHAAFPEDDPTRFSTPGNWDEDLFGPKSSTATPILSRGSSKFDPNNPYGGYSYNKPANGPRFNDEDRPHHRDRDHGYDHSKGYPDERGGGCCGEDKFYGFPPGVAVRAHVQSLDILPYSRRAPSPGEAIEYPFERHSRDSSTERSQRFQDRRRNLFRPKSKSN
nr:PREDICTED: uncharacterized protein LOC109035379 [Bemisia tabaci]